MAAPSANLWAAIEALSFLRAEGGAVEAKRKTLFISRAGSDADFAAEIGRILEAAGYGVILQQWDFANRHFMERMHEALSGGARVVALLSPEYLGSDHCQAEWMNAIAGDPLNRNGRLILLRVAECEPPGLLAGLAYCDVVPIRDNHALLADVVLSALRDDGRGSAPIAGPYWHAPRTILDVNAIRPTPGFTGRVADLAALERALAEPDAIAVVHGLGGTGKSALAREYAWNRRERYAAVWWLNAADEISIVDGLVALGSIFVRGLEQLADRREAAHQVVTSILGGFTRPLLLIFDNLEDEGLLQAWRPRQGQGRQTLVTTRIARWGADVATVALGSWPPEDAVGYMRHQSGRSDLSEADAQLLSQALGGLPLALAHAAAYLRDNQTVRVQGTHGYLARLTQQLNRAPRRAEYPRAVFATFQTALSTAEGEAPGAAAVLCWASLFAPEAVPEEVLQQELGLYPEGLRPALPEGVQLEAAGLRAAVADPNLAAEALGALDRLSLISFDGETRTFSLHRLVQAAGRDLLGQGALPWVRCAIAAANGAFPFVEPAAWPVCQRLLPHARAVLEALPPAEKDAPFAAQLAQRCGSYLRVRAAFAESEALMRRALSMNETDFGPEHPEVARVLNNLALLLQDTNRLAEAEPVFRRALAINEAVYGPQHSKVATILNNLALLLQDTNRLDEAEPLVRRALAIDEANNGPQHLSVAADLDTLAQLLQATNRLAEAEPLMRRALDIIETGYGPDYPIAATVLNNLARLLQATDRSSEAEPLVRRALAIDEASYGSEHPAVATGLNTLGHLLAATNRPSEAEVLVRRALAIDEASFGAQHPRVATGLMTLARLLQRTDRPLEAEPLVRRALAILESSYGPEHPAVVAVRGNLAGS
jgi:tetratricopeptide (TPR) repeat protein